MEEVDIVDAHDNVIKKADRSVAHKNGLLHRVVHVMVFDPDGRLFMQQRALSKDVYPGHWEGSLSGHVLSGETPKQAAERELHEELGVCLTPKHFKKVLTFGLHADKERVLSTLYAVKDFKGDIKLDEEEIKQGEFWSLKKVEAELKGRKLFHPLFKKAFDDFKAMGEKAKEWL